MRLWNRLQDKLQDCRFFLQRGKNGYCDKDAWDIDYWFLSVIPRMLDSLIQQHSWYPLCEEFPDEESYVAMLRKMKFLFEEANESTCSLKNEYEGTFTTEMKSIPMSGNSKFCELKFVHSNEGQFNKWMQREEEIEDYRNNCLEEALSMFSKYFRYLWD